MHMAGGSCAVTFRDLVTAGFCPTLLSVQPGKLGLERYLSFVFTQPPEDSRAGTSTTGDKNNHTLPMPYP
jgi:hypothetical protein